MLKLKELIEQLKIIRTETKSKISDEIVFENAVKIYISNRINESKNTSPFQYPKKEGLLDNEKEIQPITDSQKWKLKKLGYKGTLDITKLEAMTLITKYLK